MWNRYWREPVSPSDGFPAQGPEKCIPVHFEQPGKKFQSHKDSVLLTHICLTFKFVSYDCCYFYDNNRLRFCWSFELLENPEHSMIALCIQL